MKDDIVSKMKEIMMVKKQAIDTNAAFVRDGLLSRDEAAKCICGAMMKASEKLGAGKVKGNIGYYRLCLDQELDGAENVLLRVGVHI